VTDARLSEAHLRAGRAARAPWLPASAYFLVFATLLAPMALQGRLPGNCDTWLNGIALPNAVLARAEGLLTGADPGTSLYPETEIFGFGESAFGVSALFMIFRVLSGGDAQAYYLFAVTILALDGLGVFLLARLTTRSDVAAAFAGLAFAASGYTLGNLDSPHTSFFFLAFTAMWKLGLHLRDGRLGDLLAAAALGGAQVWFSAYLFLFMLATAGGMLAISLVRNPAAFRARVPRLGAAGLLFCALCLPFFAWHASARADSNFANPWNAVFLAEVHSLDPEDLLRSLDNNILYPFHEPIRSEEIGRTTHAMIAAGALRLEDLTSADSRTILGTLSSPDDVKFFVTTRRCAFIGFTLYALAAAGVAARRRWDLVVLYLVSLLVAFGPFVTIAGRLIPNVTWPAYRWLEAAAALRVPSRAFSFALLAVCLASAAGLEALLGALSKRSLRLTAFVPLLASGLVLAENVPLPLASFEGASLAEPEPLVTEYFHGRSPGVILDMPSRPGGALFRDSGDLFEWNREIIYMNRQTYHRQSIINGVHGFFPESRIEAQRLIEALPEPRALEGLRRLGVDHIVYHHDLELPWEGGLYDRLSAVADLEVIDTSREVTIFGWSAAAGGSGP